MILTLLFYIHRLMSKMAEEYKNSEVTWVAWQKGGHCAALSQNGKWYRARITNMILTLLFYIHRLMSKMAEEYKNSEVTWVAWQKGGHCAALSQNGKWYRARITNMILTLLFYIHRLMSKMAEEYKNSEVTWVAWQKGGHCAALSQNGKWYRARITNMILTLLFYIHRLMSKMAEEYKNSEVTWVAWQKGGHCAALSQNGKWYRARITNMILTLLFVFTD